MYVPLITRSFGSFGLFFLQLHASSCPDALKQMHASTLGSVVLLEKAEPLMAAKQRDAGWDQPWDWWELGCRRPEIEIPTAALANDVSRVSRACRRVEWWWWVVVLGGLRLRLSSHTLTTKFRCRGGEQDGTATGIWSRRDP